MVGSRPIQALVRLAARSCTTLQSCVAQCALRSVPQEARLTTCLASCSPQELLPWSWTQLLRSYGYAAAAALQDEPASATRVAARQDRVPGVELYRVAVQTGNLRGAGTPSTATVQLIGSTGITERVVVGSDEQGTLDRGSTRTIDILVPSGTLGSLRRVSVSKQRNLTEGDGWYLKQVEVTAPSGESQVFPCDGWLGESDAGDYFGPLERNLLPAVLPIEKPAPVKVAASGTAIPHPEKVYRAKTKGFNTRGFGYGGEDAYFFAHNSNGMFGMGVADGVYMWHEQGIDSGLMSRALMDACRAQISAGVVDIITVLKYAVSHVQSSQLHGSTTMCMLTINQATGQLHSANLGDSGFLVFSPAPDGVNYDLKFRTDQLEHSFGCPYQLGHFAKANKVEDSDFASFYVAPGDVVVMGTDGLLDNLSDLDMAKEITGMVREGLRANQMAQRLTKLAFEASMDRKRVTPYSKGASEAFNMVYSGGKPDDITVLVATCT